MRIIIDMQGVQASNAKRGIGRYTLSLVEAMIKNSPLDDIILVCNALFPKSIKDIRERLKDQISQYNIKIWMPVRDDKEVSKKIIETFFISQKPDIILISSLFEGFNDDSITSIHYLNKIIPVVVIQYDLIPLIYEKLYLNTSDMKEWYLNKIENLKKADLLLAISDSTKNETEEYLKISKNKIVNISAGAQKKFQKIELNVSQQKNIEEKYNITKPFIMYTGGIDYRKNVEALIHSYSMLVQELIKKYQLVIVCAISELQEYNLNSLAKKYNLDKNDVVFTNYVSENELVALYNLCKVFVFPSFHEGFGFPILEAMQCQKAVICGKNSSLVEVIGLEEAMFDAKSDKSIAMKIEQVLTDENFCKFLEEHSKKQAKKFSWDKTAKSVIKALQSIMIDIKTSDVNMPKLAYISPLPPEQSGISDYSAELLPELSKFYKIDIILNQDEVSNQWIKNNCEIKTIEWFKLNSSQYQRVIYHFGNSIFHKHMFDLLEEIPGVVVLHDFFLSGILSNMEFSGYKTSFFVDSIYNSHGYKALTNYFKADNMNDIIEKYPANLSVLQNALSIIFHSNYSVNLVSKWYPNVTAKDYSVIPLLRTKSENIDKIKAKESLNLPLDSFVICSFGILGEKKLNHRLLQSFLDSSLSTNKNCYLIFVGKNDIGSYGIELVKTIKNSKIQKQIKITGWTDSEKFITYLKSADIAVQLRTSSRGETSAAVLDCMNYGLPTIVNANGSMSELPYESVLMIDDDFINKDLTDAIEKLYNDKNYRIKLSKNAKLIIDTVHKPSLCAKKYHQSIENVYAKTTTLMIPNLINSIISDKKSLSEQELKNLSHSIAYNFLPQPKIKQLFVDISELVQRDSKSGIQRVVRNILKELIENPPNGYRVEPVYANGTTLGYSYARTFMANFLDYPQNIFHDDPIDFYEEDIFLGLDLSPHIIPLQFDYLENMNQKGVKIFFVLYDMLPILQADTFVDGAKENYLKWLHTITKFDAVITISKSVANELENYLKKSSNIFWFHLGANMQESIISKGLPKNSEILINSLSSKKTFLMVGTIEPRKGYVQTLETFEQLWKENIDINLVIVGKIGWLMENFIKKLETHSKLNSSIFWFKDISDEYLQKIYSSSICLIAASYGEGFGLPLIEAARFKLPIIARDIPVFREVGGDNSYYYQNSKNPSHLVATIKKWLELYDLNKHPKSEKIPYLTWQQSTEQLLENVLGA